MITPIGAAIKQTWPLNTSSKKW